MVALLFLAYFWKPFCYHCNDKRYKSSDKGQINVLKNQKGKMVKSNFYFLASYLEWAKYPLNARTYLKNNLIGSIINIHAKEQ